MKFNLDHAIKRKKLNLEHYIILIIYLYDTVKSFCVTAGPDNGGIHGSIPR